MKRIIPILLVSTMLITLTSCGKSPDVKEFEPESSGKQIQIEAGGEDSGTTTPAAENESEKGDKEQSSPGEPGTSESVSSENQSQSPETTKNENQNPTSTASEKNTEGTVAVTGPSDNESGSKSGTFTAEDCKISVAGVTLSIGMDFLPYVEKLGNARIEEGQACLDGGYDTNYYYGDSLSVYTYAEKGKQIIYDIYITGSEYATRKGAKVGKTTRAELYEIYGEATNSFLSTERYQLSGSNVMVSFAFSSDVLESIDILDSEVNG